MKSSQESTAAACAKSMMETLPFVMRTIGVEMRHRHEPELSMPQFVALMNVWHCPGISVSDVKRELGSTLSATSKLLDGLIARQLLRREVNPEDRRRATLFLTEQGYATVQKVHENSQSYLLEKLTQASDDALTAITAGMEALRRVFTPVQDGTVTGCGFRCQVGEDVAETR